MFYSFNINVSTSGVREDLRNHLVHRAHLTSSCHYYPHRSSSWLAFCCTADQGSNWKLIQKFPDFGSRTYSLYHITFIIKLNPNWVLCVWAYYSCSVPLFPKVFREKSTDFNKHVTAFYIGFVGKNCIWTYLFSKYMGYCSQNLSATLILSIFLFPYHVSLWCLKEDNGVKRCFFTSLLSWDTAMILQDLIQKISLSV